MATEGRKFANQPYWPQIQRRHELLHQLAREAKGLLDSGHREEALATSRRMILENDALMAELRALMPNAPNGGGEESYHKPINIFVDMVHDILSQFTDDDSL
ncbi:hypothetical protein HFU84_13870, partial [Acidithiobacillus sp. CV18-2]|nr:hypothetical protein [Acidithiobacillus sp. CV18-2]